MSCFFNLGISVVLPRGRWGRCKHSKDCWALLVPTAWRRIRAKVMILDAALKTSTLECRRTTLYARHPNAASQTLEVYLAYSTAR